MQGGYRALHAHPEAPPTLHPQLGPLQAGYPALPTDPAPASHRLMLDHPRQHDLDYLMAAMLPAPAELAPTIRAMLHRMLVNLVGLLPAAHKSLPAMLALPLLLLGTIRLHPGRYVFAPTPAQPTILFLQRRHPRRQGLYLRLLRSNDLNQFISGSSPNIHIRLFPRFRT